MRPYKRYTPDMISDICELYREGKTIRQIASKLERSYGGVHRILVANSVPLWPRGVHSGTRKGSPPQQSIE